MGKNEIIYRTKPKIFNIYVIVISLSIGGYLIYISDLLLAKLLVFTVFIVPVILDIIRSYFANGIVISDKRISLLKRNLKGKTLYKWIDYKNIKSVRYNEGGLRQDSAIYIETNLKSNIKVLLRTKSFEFGQVLKFLYDKGIRIDLVHSDDELRMLID